MTSVVDALGRTVEVAKPPQRIVSLVPSETESVVELVGLGRLVGRTRYCIEPAGRIEAVPDVGGTKKLDVDAVEALRPDLVLANQEENGRRDVEQLIERGLPVHVSFPHGVAEAVEFVETLARLLHLDPAEAPAARDARRTFEVAQARLREGREPLRVCVPIWRDPWMTFDGRTFASDLLDLCGARNVFSDRPRRYPLAADLGRAPALPQEAVGERDTRYPRIRPEEIVERGAEAILLPDEPYAFGAPDADTLAPLGLPVSFVSGADLFWYGTRLARSIPRLTEVLAALSTPGATPHSPQ